jgi:hypothetical protein
LNRQICKATVSFEWVPSDIILGVRMPTIRNHTFSWQIDDSIRSKICFSVDRRAHLGFISFIDFFGLLAVIVLNRVINVIADIVFV